MKPCSGIRPVTWVFIAAFSFAVWALTIIVALDVIRSDGVFGAVLLAMLAACGVVIVWGVRA